MVLRIAPDAPQLVEGSAEEVAELRALAARSDVARLRRMFRALVKEQEDLAWAPQPFAVLEMALVRLATLPAGDEVAALLSRLEALEARLRGAGPAGSPPPAASGPGSRARPRAARRRRARRPRPRSAAPLAGAAAPRSLPPAVVFDRLRAFAGKQDPGLFAALDGGRLVRIEASRLCLSVPAGFAARRLEQKREPLERCCESFFGRRVAIELEILAEAPAAGPARGSDAEALRAPAPAGALASRGQRRARAAGGRDRRDPPAGSRAMSQPDLGALLAKAKEMQTRLAELQRELAQRRIEGSAGGGMVTVVASGDLRILEIQIEPSLLASGDREMLQDLTAAAVNAALANAQRAVQEELQRHPVALGTRIGRVRTSPPIERLVAALRRLPGIGEKSAHPARLLPGGRAGGAGPGARRRDPAAQEGDRALRRVLRSHGRLALRDLPGPEARRARSCAWSRSRPTSRPSTRTRRYTGRFHVLGRSARADRRHRPERAADRRARAPRARAAGSAR